LQGENGNEEDELSNGGAHEDGDEGSYLLFKLDERLFKFRGDKIPAGQFEFNFTFQIPVNIPSSFKFISAVGDLFSV
jgi:Arrestin (or S-antigen), N-terminal domain